MESSIFVCYLRPARNKARTAGTIEVLSLLRDLQPVALSGGPLSEQSGVFWIAIPAESVEAAIQRLPRLGYTYAVDLLEPLLEPGRRDADVQSDQPRLVRWRRKTYALKRVYEENAAELRERAPDRRTFLIETGDGMLREITGYRGSGEPLARR